MRGQGTITNWKDDQGFGFITPAGGGAQVFFHVTSLVNRRRRPLEQEVVAYELTTDHRGRLRAENVSFVGDSSVIPRWRGMLGPSVPALFLVFVAGAVLTGHLPPAVLAIYLVASAATFLAYAHDKSAAQRRQWRTAESTLHVLSLCGGWPGALIAQRVLRHKSRKASFQFVFWATIALNCAGLGWSLTTPGVNELWQLLFPMKR